MMDGAKAQPPTSGLPGPGAWAQFIQSVGFPVAFLAFLCVMAARYVPPIVDAHVELLRRTGDAIESIDESMRQSTATLQVIMQQRHPDAEWRLEMARHHADLAARLDDIQRTLSVEH